MANTYAWNTGSGDFATPSDWNDVVNGDTVSTVAPGSLDTAYLDPAIAATVTGSGVVTSLHLGENAGTMTLAGVLAASGVTLDGGPVAVSGNAATLFSEASIAIGLAASAVLDVLGGGLVAVGQTAANGADNIDIGAAAGLNGAMTVDGAGSLLSSGAGALGVGLGGVGVLAVTDGGVVLTSAADYSGTQYGFYVGGEPDGGFGTGEVTVDGTGSLLGSDGQIAIGVAESGSLTVSDLGVVDETAALPDQYPDIMIGADLGGDGSVLVTTGGVLNAGQGAIAVGMAGFGTLNVQQGGTVLAGSAQYSSVEGAVVLGWNIAFDAAVTGTGTLTVSGAGSLLRSDGAIYDGFYGTGSLTVSDAGTVEITGTLPDGKGSVVVGIVAGSVGSLGVDGDRSLLDAGGGFISVGNAGTGSLSVTNGGTVLASAAQYNDGEEAVRTGWSAGGDGVVTVANIGSTLAADGAVWVGNAGSGTLNVDYSGSVSAGGANDGGTGLLVGDGAGAGVVQVTGGTLDVSDAALIGGAGGLAVAQDGTVGIGGDVSLVAGATLVVDATSFLTVGAVTGALTPGAVSIFSGATLGGSGLVDARVENAGAVLASGGTLELDGAGGGSLEVAADSTLRIYGGTAGGTTATFEAGSATLILGIPGGGFQGVHFAGLDDRIEFAGFTIDGAAVTSPGTVTITVADGAQPFSYAITGASFAAGVSQTFAWGQDAATGDGYIETACFAAGTRIATERGEVAVEELRDGDITLSPWGERQPVVWRGHRRVACARHPRPWDVCPVRVRAGAFGEGLPRRDLKLSPDHAVFVAAPDGRAMLVPVRYLINGASLQQERAPAIDYWHVELPRHGVLLAEGLPAESYLDTGNRAAFGNGGGATMLHPSFAPAGRRVKACADLICGGPRLATLRRRLIGRLPDLGFAITDDAALRVELDGRAVPPAADRGWLLVPVARATSLRLRSRVAAPAELDPLSEDRRRLGVPLAALRIDGDPVSLDDPRLRAGWHVAEAGLRWTGGDAAIDVRGARRVEFALAAGLLRYAVGSRHRAPRRIDAACGAG